MPYKFEYSKKRYIPRQYDRRIKLTESEREDIRRLYHVEGWAIRKIARHFEGKCSRRTIQMEVRPELRKKLGEAFKKRRSDGRYKPEKEAWARTMREHRRHKKGLQDRGKLIEK